jgi:hypothetical protein
MHTTNLLMWRKKELYKFRSEGMTFFEDPNSSEM